MQTDLILENHMTMAVYVLGSTLDSYVNLEALQGCKCFVV